MAAPLMAMAAGPAPITDVALATGQDAVTELEAAGFEAVRLPLAGEGEEAVYLGVSRSGQAPVTGLVLSSSGAQDIQVGGVSYTKVSGGSLAGGSLYACWDSAAGDAVCRISQAFDSGFVDQPLFALASDGTSPLRWDSGEAAMIDGSYLYLTRTRICKPYLREIYPATGGSLQEAVAAAAALGCDDYYDNGLVSADGSYLVIGYVRTGDPNKAITAIAAAPTSLVDEAVAAAAAAPTSLVDEAVAAATAAPTSLVDEAVAAATAAPQIAESQDRIYIEGIEFSRAGETALGLQDDCWLYTTKDKAAGNPILALTFGGRKTRPSDVMSNWIELTFYRMASGQAQIQVAEEELYRRLVTSDEPLRHVTAPVLAFTDVFFEDGESNLGYTCLADGLPDPLPWTAAAQRVLNPEGVTDPSLIAGEETMAESAAEDAEDGDAVGEGLDGEEPAEENHADDRDADDRDADDQLVDDGFADDHFADAEAQNPDEEEFAGDYAGEEPGTASVFGQGSSAAIVVLAALACLLLGAAAYITVKCRGKEPEVPKNRGKEPEVLKNRGKEPEA